METLPKSYHSSSPVLENCESGNDTLFTAPGASVGEMLATVPAHVRRVYVTGDVPGGHGIAGLRTWALAIAPPWKPLGDQYVSVAQPRLTYRHELTGQRVTIMRADSWFGDADPSTCATAWEMLGDALTVAWSARAAADGPRSRVHLVGYPVTTGRLLLERQWTEQRRRFVPLSPDLQQLVRDTATQGRFQLGPAADAGADDGLWIYDAAFMYAACANELPTGPVEHDNGTAVEPYVRGRYRVQFRAPRSWRHIGILGVRDPESGAMTWPADAGWHETWADGCEVQLAQSYGWTVRPVERLLWRERSGRPLDTWARRIVKLRGELEHVSPELEPIAGAMRSALRGMLVQTIGAMTGAPRKMTRTAPVDRLDMLPADSLEPVTFQGDAWTWVEAVAPAHESMQHPEWSAHVWAKARARLLQDRAGAGALTIPPADVFALALDSIATTAPVPWWSSSGRVGEFRLKSRVPGPVPPCRNMLHYYALGAVPA